MKNFLFFILTCSVFMYYSCDNQSKGTSDSIDHKDDPMVLPTDTISPAQFAQWTQAWDSLGSNYSDTALVKYYNMPLVDLTQVVGEEGTAARFYQGLESLGADKYIAHLIVCGTDKKGNDVGNYFDITSPCPPTCHN